MTEIRSIGVLGVGTMGRGIIQLFAQSGYQVRCFDSFDGAVVKAMDFIAGLLERAVERGGSREVANATMARIHACSSLEDLADCDLVVEAIVETMDAKQAVFRELEAVVSPTCILASNTSSLTVAEIAAACAHPERVAGLHFFNPVPLMKVAEIIPALRSGPENIVALKALIESCGHRGVVAADQPGFLVNHAGRGLYTEGLRIIEDQCASVQDVDTLMREAAGFKMGPFELLDLTGLDVSGKVMESIYEQFQQESRFRPSPLVAPRIAAGLFGRKSGEGWYRYDNNQRQDAAPLAVPDLPGAIAVWVDSAAEQADALLGLVREGGACPTNNPDEADLLLIQPWGWDVSSYCSERDLDASRCVAVDPLPGLGKHRTLMISPITTAAAREAAHALLAQGAAVTVINDSPGFVCQRILATVVNIAANIVQRGIATVSDLEDAVRLGLGYPAGPLSLGEQIGGERVLAILEAMQIQTGDMRYRPSLWLSRRVRLGQSLLVEEASRV
ncbi:3-hydroxyacyl-CoA dehydrogenase [Haliea sp. E1-2-M8]|uniref:3-hydroxyacyl-CoA dehydrogenase n=1 Tax=Haliea sp. E1-2-M8 TaxID=3064706 RepID=UPI002719C86A|nr:3-hydroxyacyl-CoA dehydrogenase [Haliea sp. E1-2-M8]MDO8864100.1 3-hydroxyacyl-CoA dehydrogenase [Haliea sp. E1-2-M8]